MCVIIRTILGFLYPVDTLHIILNWLPLKCFIVYWFTWVACLPKQFLKTSMAVRFVILFFEGPLIELFQAKGAHKMLWMELLEHGGYAPAGNRLVASGTQWPTFCMVVRFTVWLTFVVKELATNEWHTAVLGT